MVAAVIIVLVASVVRAVAGVPDVSKLRHRGGLLLVDLLQEPWVNRPAVAAHAAVVEVKRLGNQTLVACHDVCQVAQRLRCVSVCPDVDVYPASPAGIALRACVAELEREYILQRQREGIAIAKELGKYKGRKPIQVPEFEQVIAKWRSGTITAAAAMRTLHMSKTTFYRKVKHQQIGDSA